MRNLLLHHQVNPELGALTHTHTHPAPLFFILNGNENERWSCPPHLYVCFEFHLILYSYTKLINTANNSLKHSPTHAFTALQQVTKYKCWPESLMMGSCLFMPAPLPLHAEEMTTQAQTSLPSTQGPSESEDGGAGSWAGAAHLHTHTSLQSHLPACAGPMLGRAETGFESGSYMGTAFPR